MPRALGGTSPSTRSPPMSISPDVGRSSPAIIRSSVVFPEPEEPSSTRNSPSRIERSPPRTAATRTRALTCMCSPSLISRARLRRSSLAGRPTTGRVVGRCPPGKPVPEGLGILCQTPFLEDRQRHRPHSPLARTCGETLLLQPGLELVRRGVGGDGLLEQPSLDREADRVGSRVALAPLAPPLRRLKRGEQLAADVARAGRRAVAHAPPLRAPNANPSSRRRRSAIRASSTYPGRSGRW